MSVEDDGFNEPLSPMSPKTPSRPLVVRKQSSRLWDQDSENEMNDLNSNSLESMLSPPRNPLSPSLQNDGRIRSERSNQLWGAAASTLSPHQHHRKSVREVALAHNIEPTLDHEEDDSSDGDSITSNVSEKLVEQAVDLANENTMDESSALGAFASYYRNQGADISPEKKYTMSKGKDDNVLNRWRRIVLCAVHLRFADCAGQQEDSFHASELFPMATPLGLTEVCLPDSIYSSHIHCTSLLNTRYTSRPPPHIYVTTISS